jgi:uncharacterized surface protein with fasciclin (FAS1) repeats
MNEILRSGLFFSLIVLILAGCKDPWEDHVKPAQGIPEENLYEMIRNTPELYAFAGYLLESGWQEELESSKSFTVWAPTNNAMQEIDPAGLENSADLANFVNNHIAFTAYSYYSPDKYFIVKTYSGKNIVIDNQNGRVGDANLLEPYDRVASNGLLHVIDAPLVPKPNVWEIIESTDQAPKHVGYLKSLTGMVFDPNVGTVIGVDPVTGEPVYDTLSGMVWSNRLVEEIRDLKHEDTLSTILLIEDPVWDSEFSKFRSYLTLSDSVESDELTYWMISRDLVFSGYMELDNMPDTLVSRFGIKIPFDRAAVEQTYQASNGIIYVLSSCDVRLQDKIHPYIVEGEDTTKIVYAAVSGQTGYTRQTDLASGGYDFILDNHGASPGKIRYHVGEFAAGIYYEFYWVAVNDFDYSYRNPDTTAVIQQKLEFVRLLGISGENYLFGQPLQISDLIEVTDSTYETAREVYVGKRYFTTYQDVWLQVTGSGRNTTICLDYLKAVPVLE